MAKDDAKIIIGGDAQRAVKSLQDVSKNLGGLGNSMNSFLGQASGFLSWQTAAAAGAGALVGGLASMIKEAIDTADQMANMSARTGIATESLSKLAYAANQSDVSNETLQKSLKFLNTNLYDVAQGNETAIEKFKEFGVEVKNADGTVKNAEQALLATAEAYTKLENDAAKTALATEIFGRAGQELMPLLAEGSKGIKEMTDEAKKLGLEVNSTTAAAAERFNDNLDKMKGFTSGVAMAMLDDLVPALDAFSNSAENGIQSGGEFWMQVKMIGSVASDSLGPIGALADGIKALFFWQEKVNAEYKSNQAGMKFTEENISDGRNPFVTVTSPMDDYMAKMIDANRPKDKKKSKDKKGSSGGSKTKVEEDFPIVTDYWKIQDQALANYIAQLDTNSLIQNELNSSPFEGDGDTAFYYQTMSAQLQFIDSSKEAWTGYFDDIQVGFMDHMNALGSDYGQALGGIASMFEAFANTSAEQQGILFDISKAFRAAEIISSTWSTAQKAYEWGMGAGGPILGGIFMASAIATGIGNLTSLLSTQPGQTSISGGGVAPVPNFAQRNPQGGSAGGGNKTIIVKYDGLVYGDKDKFARDMYEAFAKAAKDGMGR